MWSKWRALATTVVAISSVIAVSGCGTAGTGASPAGQTWLTADATAKSVDWYLIAAYNNSDSGFNFDGYSNGRMVLTIPVGWAVYVTFRNHASTMNHSAMVVAYSQRAGSAFTTAFPGAATPQPTQGTAPGQQQQFNFTATVAGKYALVCGVPGHAQAGMWDTVVVSATATAPSLTT